MINQRAWTRACGLRCLWTARVAYVALQVFRLEAIVTNALCLTPWGAALLAFGILLGVGCHVLSLAQLARGVSAAPRLQRQGPGGAADGGGTPPAAATSSTSGVSNYRGEVVSLWRTQRLVAPLSLAGLTLELLSGAPPAALPHARAMAFLLLLSIALHQEPLRSVLPQLAAALVLDFAGFMAALLTQRYITPLAVLQHLLSSTVAAIGVVSLAPLIGGLIPLPSSSSSAAAAPPAEQQHQRRKRERPVPSEQGREPPQQGLGGGDARRTVIDGAAAIAACGAAAGSAATWADRRGDAGEADRLLPYLPPGVIKLGHRSLRPAYGRLVFLERSASALLLTFGAILGVDGAGGLAAIRAGLVGATDNVGGTSAAAVGPPLLHARAAAATLSSAAASTLLLLNGLLAVLPGRVYTEHTAAVNAAATGLHAAAQAAALLTTRLPRSRATLLRAMMALTANLVANGDPWVGFAAQLAALLGAVTALDVWLAPWGLPPPTPPPPHVLTVGGLESIALQAVPPAAAAAAVAAEEVALEPALAGAMPPWLSQLRLLLRAGASEPAGQCAVAAHGGGHWLAAACYAAVAAAGYALYAQLPRCRHVVSYRLYRRFYLPASYGGACITVPLPEWEEQRLMAACAIASTGAAGGEAAGALPVHASTSSAATQPGNPLLVPHHDSSASTDSNASGLFFRDRDQDRLGVMNRRSVSLNNMAPGSGRAAIAAGAAAGGSAAGSAAGGNELTAGAGRRFAASSTVMESSRSPLHDTGAAAPAAIPVLGSSSSNQGLTGFQKLMGSYTSPFTAAEAATAQQSAASAAAAATLAAGADGELRGPGPPPPAALGPPHSSMAGTGADPGSSIDRDMPMASESGGSLLASALDLDEADVISGKIDIQGQLCKLAGLSSSAATGRELDRLLQVLGSNGTVTGSSANTASLPGGPFSGGRPGPSRSPSDISHLLAAAAASSARPQYGDRAEAGSSGGLPYPSSGGGGSGGGRSPAPAAMLTGGAGGSGGGGSFLASVAASLSSAGTGGGRDAGSLAAGNRMSRLRGTPMRARSDLAVWKQYIQQQHAQQQHLSQAGHRPPRRSPSDVSYLGLRHRIATAFSAMGLSTPSAAHAAAGGRGPAASLAPPQTQSEATAATPAAALLASRKGHERDPTVPPPLAAAHAGAGPARPSSGRRAPVVPATAGTAEALMVDGIRAAGLVAGSEYGVPPRRASRQFSHLLDSTGLALLGQNLIMIGGSSGGHNNLLFTSTQSPVFQDMPSRASEHPQAGAPASAAAGGGGAHAAPVGLDPDLRADDARGAGTPVAWPTHGPPVDAALAAGSRPSSGPGARSGWSLTAGRDDAAAALARSDAPPEERLRQLGQAIGGLLLDADGHGGRRPGSSSSKPHVGNHGNSSDKDRGLLGVAAAAADPALRCSGPSPPLVRSDNMPREIMMMYEGQPAYMRQVSDGQMPSVLILGGPGGVGNRHRMRVSWSDLEGRGSGGSTGTASTMISGGSRASLAGSAAGGVTGGGGAGVADGGRRLGPSSSPSPTQRNVRISAQQAQHAPVLVQVPVHPYHSPLPQQQQQQQQHRHPQGQHTAQPVQQQHHHHLHHQESFGQLQLQQLQQLQQQWPPGSGSNASSAMAELEQARVARELASLWTSSSIGDNSYPSQVPSTMSSVATTAAAAAAADACRSGSHHTPDGPGRILSAVQEVPENELSSEVCGSGGLGVLDDGVGRSGGGGGGSGGYGSSEKRRVAVLAPNVRGSTRHRRLSHVMAPGPSRPASAAGSRSQVPQLPTSQPQPSLFSVDGASGAATPARPNGPRPVPAGEPPAGGTGSTGDPPLLTSKANSNSATATGAGGSIGSAPGGTVGSTNMSFGNWANADDLAAMFLGAQALPRQPSSELADLASSGSGAAPVPHLLERSAPRFAVLQTVQDNPSHTQQQSQIAQQRLMQLQRDRLLVAAGSSGGASGGARRDEHTAALRTLGFIAPSLAARRGGAAGVDGRGAAEVAFVSGARPHVATAVGYVVPAQLQVQPSRAGAAAGGGGGHTAVHHHHLPSRSPSVPNMAIQAGRPGPAKLLGHGSVRRSSSMGKSRLGNMVSSSSSNAVLTASSPNASGAYAVAASSRLPTPGRSAPQLQPATGAGTATGSGVGVKQWLPLSPSTTSLSGHRLSNAGAGGASHAPPPLQEPPLLPGPEALDSYADMPPMRTSQAQLAAALPYSSLRGSVVGPSGSADLEVDAAAAAGSGGGGDGVGAAAGQAWSQLMSTPVVGRNHHAPLRRASFDERTIKQMVAVRRLLPALSSGPGRQRGRRRSAGLTAPLGYVPSRLSQDGRQGTAGALAPPARRVGSRPNSGSALSPQGPPLRRHASLDLQRHPSPLQRVRAAELGGGGELAAAPPHNAIPRASAAGSVATAVSQVSQVTASSTSLLSFADVALGGVYY